MYYLDDALKKRCAKVGAWVQDRQSATLLGTISHINAKNQYRVDWKVVSDVTQLDTPMKWITASNLNLFISENESKRHSQLTTPKPNQNKKKGNKKKAAWTPPSASPPPAPQTSPHSSPIVTNHLVFKAMENQEK